MIYICIILLLIAQVFVDCGPDFLVLLVMFGCFVN